MSNAKHNVKKRVAVLSDPHYSLEEPGLPAELFQEISQKADLLLLGGDITDQGLAKEAEAAARALGACSIPVVAVLGNHDFESGQENEIKEILHQAKVFVLEHHPYTIDDLGIAGTKGFGGGFAKYLLAPFGEPLMKKFVAETTEEAYRLENQLRLLSTKKTIVLLHYAPIRETVKGEPLEIHPFLGCSRLAETIDRYEVNAVFHGHAHHGTFSGKTSRNIPVYNCCAALLKRVRHQPYEIFEF